MKHYNVTVKMTVRINDNIFQEIIFNHIFESREQYKAYLFCNLDAEKLVKLGEMFPNSKWRIVEEEINIQW